MLKLTCLSAGVIDGKENGGVLGDDSRGRDRIEIQWME